MGIDNGYPYASDAPQGEDRAEKIRKNIELGSFRIKELQVQVVNNAVTLFGEANTIQDKHKAFDLAHNAILEMRIPFSLKSCITINESVL